MKKRRIGNSAIELSVVGFGTCQLRMVPERQAIDTLKRGFELGVNWVHASPDYGGVESLVARAIRESGRADVIPVVNGWESPNKLEELYAAACRAYSKQHLELFGISCIDDDDLLLKNDVWGKSGMVQKLLQMKREGRIGATWCSTHAEPAYVRQLVECGAFDAIMLAYNPLGFHALSYHARSEGKEYEDLEANAREIFPLAAEHGVSLLVMKPLAGGMLCRSKTFTQHRRFSREEHPLPAIDILRTILQMPGVAAVVPGTASVAEAEENARAGHEPIVVSAEAEERLGANVARMRSDLCSRCGECDSTCSKGLPISWLFREGYMWSYSADVFEGIDRHHYFALHPETTIACASCTNRTCECPHGITIPVALPEIHAQVMKLREHGHMHSAPHEIERFTRHGHITARVLLVELPGRLAPRQNATCRVWLENTGHHCWTPDASDPTRSRVQLLLRANAGAWPLAECELRHDVHPKQRTFFAFDLHAPFAEGDYELSLALVTPDANAGGESITHLETRALRVGTAHDATTRAAPPSGTRGFQVRYVAHDIPAVGAPGAVVPVHVTLENTGTRTWCARPPDGKSVDLGVFCDGVVIATWKLPRDLVNPGERATLAYGLTLPITPGVHRIKLEMVEQTVLNFTDLGIPPLEVDVEVRDEAVAREAMLWRDAQATNPWQYFPTGGVAESADGAAFPVFVERARGCRVWDLKGHEFIDYTMGWGTTVLGYAHPHVTQAVALALANGSMVAFPQPIEIEVGKLLLADFPGAEMVSFGKNGSDVCTLAARLARSFTNRQTILFCGYHGWGDFWVEPMGFQATGVPERHPPLIHRFGFNDAADFLRLFDRHRKDLACVMLEPSGPWGGERGCEPDVDQAFLELLRAKTLECGALLVFDEIVTGYRYREGSVQRARKVRPDLTCLGKALASGLPLSALLGTERVMRSAYHRTRFGPTFKGEALSLHAARATIELFRAEPVAEHVWSYGERLRAGIEQALGVAGIAGRVGGPPFRMSLVFGEPDRDQRLTMRTLMHQELLRRGISIYGNGVMLPSYAHDEATLTATLRAFGGALEAVARARREGQLGKHLRIPPLPES